MGFSWFKPNRCFKSKRRPKLVYLTWPHSGWVEKKEVLQVFGCSNDEDACITILNTCCLFASHWPSSVLKPKPPTAPGSASLAPSATRHLSHPSQRLPGLGGWVLDTFSAPSDLCTRPTSHVMGITSHSTRRVTAKAKTALKVNRVNYYVSFLRLP